MEYASQPEINSYFCTKRWKIWWGTFYAPIIFNQRNQINQNFK